MAKRPVHWSEGMFLKPHHFQASDRYARERLKESEDWLHPHAWGLRSVRFDEDAIANSSVRLLSCQVRFKDGTTLNVPDEATVDPLELGKQAQTMVYLAIPAWDDSRGNAERVRSERNPRYLVSTLERPDENTGSDEEELEFRYLQARLLLEEQVTTGYEVLPVARINRAASPQAPPRIDRTYVPPILGIDAWVWLNEQVQALFRQIETWIQQEATQIVGRKVAFDSQILGDAERILRLSVLNTAFATFQSVIFTQGLHPLLMYQELCRLLGQLAIFGETRRPIKINSYDHDNIGPIYVEVITEIRRLLGELGHVAFHKRYFKLEGRRFQVHLEPDWTLETTKLYIGIETTELTDAQCDELMSKNMTDWKLGSGDQVDTIFTKALEGLKMKALSRIPPALPGGYVYFEMVRHPEYWKDVVNTRTLGLRIKLEQRGKFLSPQMLALYYPPTQQTYNIQVAVFVVKDT